MAISGKKSTTLNLCAVSLRFQSVTQKVTVKSGVATNVNFTLMAVGIEHWSSIADFGLFENLRGDAYMNASTVEFEMQVQV